MIDHLCLISLVWPVCHSENREHLLCCSWMMRSDIWPDDERRWSFDSSRIRSTSSARDCLLRMICDCTERCSLSLSVSLTLSPWVSLSLCLSLSLLHSLPGSLSLSLSLCLSYSPSLTLSPWVSLSYTLSLSSVSLSLSVWMQVCHAFISNQTHLCLQVFSELFSPSNTTRVSICTPSALNSIGSYHYHT